MYDNGENAAVPSQWYNFRLFRQFSGRGRPQAVDLLLWPQTREDSVLATARPAASRRTDPYVISCRISQTIVAEGMAQTIRPISENTLERGRGLLAQWEGERQQRIRDRRAAAVAR